MDSGEEIQYEDKFSCEKKPHDLFTDMMKNKHNATPKKSFPPQ